MKKLIIFFLLVIGFWFFSFPVSAGCGGQYESPCQSYSILVDKVVQIPGTSNYVDNLSVSDPRYKPNEYVFFKVTIKNTSSTVLQGVKGKDYIPTYLNPIEGPGTFNEATRTINWEAGDFAVDEQKTYYFKMQVNSQANLPANQGLFCLINKVEASSNNTRDDDSSQLCIEKQVVTPPKVPSAGPEMGLILFTGELLALGTGIYMSYKLKNNK